MASKSFTYHNEVTRKYRILCAIDSLTGGGAERVLSQITNRLDATRFEVHLVMTLGKEIYQQLAPQIKLVPLINDAPEMLLQLRRNRLLRLGDRILVEILRLIGLNEKSDGSLYHHLQTLCVSTILFGQYVRAIRPDCVLSFLPLTNLVCLLARRWYHLQVPMILSDRNYLSREINNLPWTHLHQICIRAYYPKVEHHIAVSEAAAVDLAVNFGVSRERITCIYNGVDHERLATAALAPLPVLLTPGEVHLVAAGRLHPQKGFDLLFDALARTQSRNWRLWLLGSGPDETKLRQQAAMLGISDHVDFLGFDANPWRWFARADIFVMSSRWEGLPNALIEAMALGLPIIATDCPSGPAEILENGHWGRLVTAESSPALATAIDTFIIDVKQRAKFALRAQQRALDFRIERMVDSYTNLMINTIKTANRDGIL